MNPTLLISAAAVFAAVSCNPAQEQQTRDTADSLQREMEQEMDTAQQQIDSIGDTLKGAADDLLDEAGETLEKAGEDLKELGN